MSPALLKCRTTCQHGQKRGCGRLIEHQIQEFEGRGVSPVQIFDDKEDRLALSVFQEDGDNGFQRFLALPLGRDVERSIPRLWEQQREQWSKEWHRFV